MPYYECLTPPGTLGDEDKRKLAGEITDIHCKETGGLALFVQVHFKEVPSTDIYQNRKPSSAVRLHARMRSGRSAESRRNMLVAYTEAMSRACNVPPSQVMVAFVETSYQNVMEGGVLLPEPGGEAEWQKQFAHLVDA